MLSKVQQWGNSQGIRIPKSLLHDSQIKVGEEVDISVQEGKIIIESINKVHGRYDIKELVAKMPKDYKPQEEDWGEPIGQEVW